MNAPAPSRTWNPWPWAVTGFLGLFAVTVVGFGVYAARQRFDLVRPDYYAAELRHDDQRRQAQAARALAGGVAVTLGPDGRVAVQLPASAAPLTGTLRLYRPSDARLDHEHPLDPDSAGRQRFDPALAPGLWRARLAWTQAGQDYLHEAVLVVPGVPLPPR
jgi:hypothetical protein